MVRSRRRTIILIIITTASAVIVAQLNLLSMSSRKIADMKEPSIVIRKSARVLEVYDGPRLVRSFTMVLPRTGRCRARLRCRVDRI